MEKTMSDKEDYVREFYDALTEQYEATKMLMYGGTRGLDTVLDLAQALLDALEDYADSEGVTL